MQSTPLRTPAVVAWLLVAVLTFAYIGHLALMGS